MCGSTTDGHLHEPLPVCSSHSSTSTTFPPSARHNSWLCAAFICHGCIVVLVTSANTFPNGLKQSLWKQTFWSAIIIHHRVRICMWCLVLFDKKTTESDTHTHTNTFLYKYVDISGGALAMKKRRCRYYKSPCLMYLKTKKSHFYYA